MPNICMTKKDAVQEHEKLVKVLRSGGKRALKAEAKDQAGELSKYRAKKDRKAPRASGRR
jgi:hypothetical protein